MSTRRNLTGPEMQNMKSLAEKIKNKIKKYYSEKFAHNPGLKKGMLSITDQTFDQLMFQKTTFDSFALFDILGDVRGNEIDREMKQAIEQIFINEGYKDPRYEDPTLEEAREQQRRQRDLDTALAATNPYMVNWW